MRDHPDPPLLSDRTDSQSSLEFMLHQYRDCKKNHAGCKRRTPYMHFHPTRLIKVGTYEDSHVRICDTQHFDKEKPYVCLSYCWGQTHHLKLTTETEERLRAGHPVSAMAKTFRDAIHVTRTLGIEFLWIDSLCIFQDNETDWAIEAGLMGSVYEMAAFTIAASSAKDSEGGLFFDRNPELLRPQCVELTWPDNPSLERQKRLKAIRYPSAGLYYVGNAPLNKRAWCNQERHLSTRLTHFTNSQLFWECRTYMASETYQAGMPWWTLPYRTMDPTVLQRTLRKAEAYTTLSYPHTLAFGSLDADLETKFKTLQELYYGWGIFLQHYVVCSMTNEADKLVAIQGIANRLGRFIGDSLVAGLWRSRLLEELCWFASFPGKPKIWRAPTWSWASIEGSIASPGSHKLHLDCPDRQLWGEVVSLDVQAKPSGELDHASLRMRCRPIRASIISSSNGIGYGDWCLMKFTESGERYESVRNMRLYLWITSRLIIGLKLI
ncbi:heterokaryon incompatibility protein-domain-containing protein [Phaeosphaeriaceae sp. PMI808]|nr:heterokaryon incompatibility protein-domain-containing protein [Phaeosphaeriaceae sp. PMI808]